MNCWLEYDSPTIDTPAVRAAARAVAEVDPYGNLHIVVDDWNLDDDNLDSCERFVAENRNDVPPSDIAAERRCLALLRGLTEEERASALALHSGFWGTPALDSAADVP